jgi:hypothetical protein
MRHLNSGKDCPKMRATCGENSPNLVILFGEKFAQSGHSVWDPSVIKKMPN